MRVRPIRCWLLVGVAASLVVALAPAGAVAEVLSCEFNRQTRELTIEFEGSAVIERQSGSPNIRVDGIVCAAPDLSANATVQTVDTIRVEGSIGDDFLTISLGGGPFAPGRPPRGRSRARRSSSRSTSGRDSTSSRSWEARDPTSSRSGRARPRRTSERSRSTRTTTPRSSCLASRS